MKQRIYLLIEERLRNRRDELRGRLAAVERDMRRESDPLSADWAEQSTQRANDEVLSCIRLTAETELREIESALRRLEEGSYGICRKCGEPIASGRLYSVPHTDCCSDCAPAARASSGTPRVPPAGGGTRARRA
jgi:RNA polymerase-binding transcription factor DksA